MPPFERYPGPPARGDHLYRVISPWRDALAWVSIAGPLTIARYLLRDGSGWRDVSVASALVAGVPARVRSVQSAQAVPVWSLETRDPVELRFVAVAPGLEGHASITVDRHACEVHVDLRNCGCRATPLAALIVIDGAEGARDLPATLRPGQTGSWTILVLAPTQ
jgi:hypothetical protein